MPETKVEEKSKRKTIKYARIHTKTSHVSWKNSNTHSGGRHEHRAWEKTQN